jgi:hypothetical protein
VDVATFKANRPEFTNATDYQVGVQIAYATNRVDPTIYVAFTEQAIELLTAHYLTLAPGGQVSRIDAKDGGGNSPYYQQFQDLLFARTTLLRIP